MPVYSLTSPESGRTYQVNIDRTPTPEDVDSIWPQLDAHAAQQEANKPFFALGDTLSGIGTALGGLPETATASYYRLTEGMKRPDQYSPEARAAFDAEQKFAQEVQRESQNRLMRGEASSTGESFRDAAPSLGFSGVTMGANILGRAVGRPAGAVIGGLVSAPSGPGAVGGAGIGGAIGETTAGMAASGYAAYRMAGNQFLDEAFQRIGEERAKRGEAWGEAEKAQAYNELLPLAQNTGLWEAGPEAVGNAVGLAAGKYVLGLGKKTAKELAETIWKKAGKKVAALAGGTLTELGTETITQVGGAPAQAQAQALAQGNPNWRQEQGPYAGSGGTLQALADVAPATLAQSALMMGAGGAIKAGQMLTGQRQQPGVGQPLSEAPDAVPESAGDLTAEDVADLEPQPMPRREPILTRVPDRMARVRENALDTEPVMEGDVITDLRVPRSPEAIAESQRIENERLAQEAKLRAQEAKARGMPMVADSPTGSRDIVDWANENPIYLPPGFSADRKLPEYDALQRNPLPPYWRQFVASSKQGGNPDSIAQRAFDAGLIAEPTPDAYLQALQEGIAGRQQYRVQFAQRDKALAQEEKRVIDFEKSQNKLAKKEAQQVPFEDIVPGDEMTIDGEQAVVRNVEYNEDGYLTNVVIEDGKRFGLMQFDPQTRGGLLVDEFKPASKTFTPAATQDQPQTITGPDVQTGTAMPVPPPTADAGAGAGVVVEGQDIVNPAQARRFLEEVGWQGANARLAEAYKATVKPLNEAVQAAQQRRAEIEDQLPPGWSTVELPSEPQYDRYRWKAIKDENGNDVAWPMSQDEYLDRAWREYGADKQPDAKTDPVYQQLTARVKQLREISDAAHAAWRAIGDHPRTAEWNAQRAAEELAAANRRAAAAKGQRTRSAKKITPTSTTATPRATAARTAPAASVGSVQGGASGGGVTTSSPMAPGAGEVNLADVNAELQLAGGFTNLDVSGRTAGFLNAEILSEARQLIADGFTTFANWSQAMVTRFGKAIKTHLERIWEQVKPMAAEMLMNYMRRTGSLKDLFAGEKAIIPPFMRDSLAAAKAMAAAGKSSEEIRAVTGWFPGKYDGKMRWEVPDEGAKYLPVTKTWTKGRDQWAANLDEVISHPVLFEAYPEARQIRVSRLATSEPQGGSFDHSTNRIRLNALNGDVQNFSTLLHEVQHWIQQHEGMAKGSNVRQFGISGVVINADQIARLDAQKQALLNNYPDVKAMEQRLQRGEDLTNDEWTRYEQVYSLPEFTANAQARLALVKSPLEQYRSTAGEIEARDVQARQAMSAEQRAATAPYSSENIAPEDAIVLMDAAGPQMSMDMPEGQDVTRSRFASPDEGANLYDIQNTETLRAESAAWLEANGMDAALEAMESNTAPAGLRIDHLPSLGSALITRLAKLAETGTEAQRIAADTLLDRAGRAWHGKMSQETGRTLQQRAMANDELRGIAPILATKQVLVERADRVVKERFEGGAEGAVEKVKGIDTTASVQAGEALAAQIEGEPEVPELGDNPEVSPVNDSRVAELEKQMQDLREQMVREQTQAESTLAQTSSTWQKIMGVLQAAGGRKSSLLTGAKGKLAAMRKAALARKAARRAEGRLSANPVEDFADDAIIGAALLAEGVVEFTNWSQAILREVGFRSGQDLRRLYAEASKKYLEALEAEKAAPTKTKGTPKQRAAREKINKAQRTAQSILDSLARRYSDPPLFDEGQRRVNAMRELYKERVKTGMPEAEFVKRAMALGANEGTAGILWEASKLEIDAREMMALEKSRAGLAGYLKKDSPALAKLLDALRKKVAPGMTWAEIFMTLPAEQKARQREIYRRLMLDERLKALSQGERLQLTNELDRAWQRERRKVFVRELEKITGLGKTPKDRDKVKAALPRLLRLMNLGMLNSETFRGAIAQEYGIQQIDAATGAELRKLGEQIQQAPEGLPRRKLEQQLMQRLQNLTGSTMAEILESWWTASVLSGWRTQMDIALSLANGLEDVTFGSLVTALRTGNGRVVKDALFGMLSNLPTAMNEALDHLLTGNRAAMRSYDAEVKAALEDGNKLFGNVGRQLLNKGGMAKLPGAFMEFVSRMMTALDHINSTSVYEGAKAMAMARHPELYEKALTISPQDRQAARTQARLELTAGEPPTTRQQRIEEDARVKEILDQRVPLEFQAQAREIGLESALQGEPTGLGHFVYKAANNINQTMRQAEAAYDKSRPDNAAGKTVMLALRLASTLVKVLTGTKFVRTVGHSVNRSLSYAPGIGLVRFAEGGMKGAKADILLAKQLIGTAVGLALLAAFRDGEDDEQGIEGSWRDLTPQQKGQLLAEGKQPYSIWTRDAQGKIRTWNYQQWGIAGVLATIGGMEDQRRYNSQGKDDLAILLDGITSGAMAWTDKTQLTGLQMLMGKDQAATSSPSSSLAGALNKWASMTAGGLVPRIFKDVDMVISPQLRDTSEWWMKWAGQVPMVRELSSGKRVNIFGEDIVLDRTPTSRITQVGTLDPALRTLGRLNERDIWLPDPTQGVRTVLLADGSRRKMTTVEKDRYQRATGAAYRKFITEQGAALLRMDAERARETISKVTERLRRQAAYDAVRR